MNRATYAGFLRAAGHRVIETEAAVWYDPCPGVLAAFPLHQPIAPAPAELRDLLKHALLLRYNSRDTGISSYFIGCDLAGYDMSRLNSKARNQTKRALERWEVVHKDGAWLAERGGALNRDTLIRQGRGHRSSAERKWRRCCEAAQDRPGFEVWAAISADRIGAVALTFVLDDVAYILLQRSATAELSTYPNNALTFRMTQEFLSRPGIRLVFYGMRSLAAPASLDHFKSGMGYSQHAVREAFAASWALRLNFAPAKAIVLPLLRRFRPAAAGALQTILTACESGSGELSSCQS